MKIVRRIILSLVPLFIVLAVLLSQPEARPLPAGRQPAGTGALSPNGQMVQQAPREVTVGAPVAPALSPPARSLPPRRPEARLDREVIPRRPPLLDWPVLGDEESGPDRLLARAPLNPGASPAPIFTFAGLSRVNGGGMPPDTIGEVGPAHYVQMVNVAFAVYDKAGNRLAGPTPFNDLFAGNDDTPNCELANDGDPVVVYDSLADRWILSQFAGAFAGSYGVCIAVSQTADPTGAYYLYEYYLDNLPDYFKIGVWSDAYYLSANEEVPDGYTAYAFDRARMLAGQPAGFVRATGETNLLLPADLDGASPPPAGSPGYFYTFKDGNYHGGQDRLEIFSFDVNWNAPQSSTFSLSGVIPVTPFTYTVCDYFNFDCIPQRNSPMRVDSISEWPMWRLQYRNFGAYETLVGNFTVDVGGNRAGIRWFELRRQGGNWQLYQEGTHAPGDGNHRWLGSIAMDGQGNIALGYSTSGTNLYPAIRYATRLAGDPLGTLQSEASLQEGSGSQIGYDRWGDYSALVVDPADECTFWYTNEYYLNTSSYWETRIGTFHLPSCLSVTEIDLTVTLADTPDPIMAGEQITYTASVRNQSTLTATNVTLTTQLPPETSLVSFSPAGPCADVGNGVECALGDLAAGAEVSFTFVAEVAADTGGGLIVARSAVSADQPDPDAGNNEAVAPTLVLEYGVALDTPPPGQASPGQAYTYGVALTNTGNITDTFDLALSGQVWNTTLSTTTIANLGPGQTSSFGVTVDVPGAALRGDADAVAVEARSRGDIEAVDTIELRTIVPYTVRLPFIAD